MADCLFERDCLSAPFPEKCFFYCIEQILRRVNPSQKRNILKISNTTADAIVAAYQKYTINKFEDLATHLTADELVEIIRVFRTITRQQLDYFR